MKRKRDCIKIWVSSREYYFVKKELVRVNTILLKKRCLDAITNLSNRLEDWFHEEWRIKKQKKEKKYLQKSLQADKL